MRALEQCGLLVKHDFGDGHIRFETKPVLHHDHLIDIKSGTIVEFSDPELDAVLDRIAKERGYRLLSHRLELRGQALQVSNEGDDRGTEPI